MVQFQEEYHMLLKILDFILWEDNSTVTSCIPPHPATAMIAFVPHYLNGYVGKGIVTTIIRRKK